MPNLAVEGIQTEHTPRLVARGHQPVLVAQFPEHIIIARRIFPVDPRSPGQASTWVPLVAAKWINGDITIPNIPKPQPPLWEKVQNDLDFIATETVTNAVTYGFPRNTASGGIPVAIGVVTDNTEGNLLLVVGDRRHGLLNKPEDNQTRGLDKVAALTKRWGLARPAVIQGAHGERGIHVRKAFWWEIGPVETTIFEAPQ